MKSEELLNSLSHVGEDLLAEAEQTVVSRRRRPWLGAAVAAVVALSVGLGGFLLLKNVSKQNPTQGGDPIDPDLPAFYVSDNYTGLSQWTFDDAERSVLADRWTVETGAERLPVYEVPVNHPDIEGWTRYSEEELRAMLREAASRLGTVLPDEMNVEQNDYGAATRVSANTELGELSVDSDGRIRILFNDAHRLTADAKIDFAEELTTEQIEAEYRDVIMEMCGEQAAELLGLPKCQPAVCDRYSSLSSSYTAYLLYPVREDPAEQLKSRYFEAVSMLTVDGRSVLGLEWYRLPEAGDTCTVSEELRLVGDYPIISLDEARQTVLAGHYYNESGLVPLLTEENLSWGQLIYQTRIETPIEHSYLLPFYRFWVPIEQSWSSSVGCTAVLVPAVDPAYLLDFPKTEQEPEPIVTTEALDPLPPEETTESVDWETEAAVQELFDSMESWYCRALTSQYADPAQVDLVNLFYDGIPGVDNTLSQEEQTALTEQGAWLELDCFKLPRDRVDAVLKEVFGTDLARYAVALNGDDGAVFGGSAYRLSQTDCWYLVHGDTILSNVSIREIRKDAQGRILITYDAAHMPVYYMSEPREEIWTVGLKADGGSYHVLFNLPGEWTVPDFKDEIDLEHCTLSIVYDNRQGYYATLPLLDDYIRVFQYYTKYPELLEEREGLLVNTGAGVTLRYVAVPGKILMENQEFLRMLDYMNSHSLYPISRPLSDTQYPFTPVDPSILPEKLIILCSKDGEHVIDIVQEYAMIYCNGTEMDCTAENRILLDCFEPYLLESSYPVIEYQSGE